MVCDIYWCLNHKQLDTDNFGSRSKIAECYVISVYLLVNLTETMAILFPKSPGTSSKSILISLTIETEFPVRLIYWIIHPHTLKSVPQGLRSLGFLMIWTL